MKSLLSLKGIILVCGLIALLFLGGAAVAYSTNSTNWRLWLTGAIPFGLVVLVIVVARGFGALTWYLAGRMENVKLPTIRRPVVRPRSKLKKISLILRWIFAALVLLASLSVIISVLIEGAGLLSAVMAGLYLGFIVFISALPLLALSLAFQIADYLNQYLLKTQAQNERLIQLLEQQHIDQREQKRKA